ncbi:hypothetical protein NPIL_68881 [Nephila pilipes]|uniref:Uncharacterized protein n=1 Tax=Nephila pilipes TaxID=299642 RepID=A0A8X6MET1_NEPPI|nr:hypothetical protein NPIL_68881 [Nephila pilipes]
MERTKFFLPAKSSKAFLRVKHKNGIVYESNTSFQFIKLSASVALKIDDNEKKRDLHRCLKTGISAPVCKVNNDFRR